MLTPEMFAQVLLEDFDTNLSQSLIPEIADQIRKQAMEYVEAVEDDANGDGVPRIVDEEGIEHQDFRVVIKVCC